jgi:hypothetical protein
VNDTSDTINNFHFFRIEERERFSSKTVYGLFGLLVSVLLLVIAGFLLVGGFLFQPIPKEEDQSERDSK